MSGTGERGSMEDYKADSGSDGIKLTQLLTRVVKLTSRLAAAPNVDELCRQAVQISLTQLGFERISIWLIDRERRLLQGTFGTDEHGLLRDERSQIHPWTHDMVELELLDSPKSLAKSTGARIFNDAHEVIGIGEVGRAALWDGNEVIGFFYIDNFITQEPIPEEQWHIFELYASTLGHLLSLKRTESALRSKEELLSQILEILPVGVFVLAPEEVIARHNSAAREMWDIDPQNTDNWVPEAVWVKDRRPVRDDEWAGRRALWYGESTLNQEVEFKKADGTFRVFLNSGVPLRNSQGELSGAVVVNQDITENKRYQQQLEAMARLGYVLRPLNELKTVLNAMVGELSHILFVQGVAIVLINAEGRFVFEAGVGDYQELQGVSVPAEAVDANATIQAGTQVVDSEDAPLSCMFKGLAHNPRYTITVPLVSENSALGAVVVGSEQKPDDATVRMIQSLANVCAAAIQRGRLYDEVTTQANRLDRVMESVNFGLILLDPQQRIVLTNQHVHEKLTHLGEIVVGEELRELGGQKLEKFLTRQSSESRTHELTLSSVIYEITTVPVGATGAEGGWLMVVHDVTRDRAIQAGIQQHQRLAAVGQMAAGIAHDFNNIMAVITLYVQMLQRNTTLAEGDRRRLHVIRDQAQNASKLIRQIQDFSRQTVIERQRVDLDQLIQETISLWARTLPETVSFVYSSDVGKPAEILAEASSIQQILTNLAVNARDAMPNGGEVKIQLNALTVGETESSAVSDLKPGHWYEIKVIDNGEGILPEHLPHIFDPFFTTKEIGKGIGLGLAQVYGIIQQHGGVVTAHSDVTRGTCIALYLPAIADTVAVPQENHLGDTFGLGNETILLVEDNAPAREATAALLDMLGYQVYSAQHGREALELFTQHRGAIQMVLSDLVMPEMGGIELYSHIKAENPNVCMVLMTGYPVDDERLHPEIDAAVEWLQKPFTVKQLTAAVRRVLARAKGQND